MTPEEQENFIGVFPLPPLPTVAPTRVPTVHSLPLSLAGVFKAMGAGDGTRAARHLLRFSAEQSPHVDREVAPPPPFPVLTGQVSSLSSYQVDTP
jgi:hypothetical protein